jgi:hypothetical protein
MGDLGPGPFGPPKSGPDASTPYIVGYTVTFISFNVQLQSYGPYSNFVDPLNR